FEYEACGQMCFPDTSSIGYGWSKTYNNSPEKTYNVTARFNMGNLRFETINWQYLQGEGTFASGFEQLDTKERGLETNNYDLRNNARRLGVIMGISTPQGLGGSNWDFSSNTVAVGYLREFSEKLSLDSEMLIRTSAVLNTSHEYVPTKGYDSPEVYYTPQNWDVVKGYSREDYSYQAEEKLQYTHNRNYNTIVGVGIRYDMPQKDYGSVEKYKYTNYSAYIQQYIQPVDKIAITLGYRYDDNTVYSSTRNPRIGIVYKPSDDLTLKFLVGSGFRAPTTKELFSGTTSRKPNPDLQPEKLQSYEMGIGYRFMKKSYFTAQAFYNKVSHLILLTNTTDTVPINGVDPRNGTWYQNQNLGIARIYGTEISNNSEVTKKLVLNTNYTYNKGEYTNLPASLTSSPSTKGFFGDDPVFDFYNEVYQKLTVSPTSSSGNKTVPSTGPMPNIATHKANVGLTYMILIDFSIYLGLSYVDVRRNIGTSPQRTTPGYKFFKVNLRKDNFLYQNMYLSLLINNATNEQFFDPGIRSASGGYYPTMHPLERRNLWFTLGYKF
ncbi:MAG: TonB-dependent receptor, partial [Leptospiraceae bacterium]|nr:TonB-dependent receptor [Leptospiraceae bacterium]